MLPRSARRCALTLRPVIARGHSRLMSRSAAVEKLAAARARRVVADVSGDGRVVTVDSGYINPMSVYVLRDVGATGEVAVVDVNTAHAVPRILKAIEDTGGHADDVRWIVPTHVHLDHAGGVAALLEACPNARVLAHPRCAKHLINPDKLVEAVKHVYGEAAFDLLYGGMDAVPESAVDVLDDEATVEFGAGKLRFMHTRGHAKHHFVVLDETSGAIFTGDAFGVAYEASMYGGEEHRMLVPSTSPSDFEPENAIEAVNRIRDCGATTAYLGHFGAWEDLPLGANLLKQCIEESGAALDEAVASGLEGKDLAAMCGDRARAVIERARLRRGAPATPELTAVLADDALMNGQGIAAAALRERRAGAP